MTVRVLGISGSLRNESLNTQLLRLVAAELPTDVEFARFEGLGAIPPYDQDVEDDIPWGVGELVEAIDRADLVIFATPEYNGSVPGQLKNAIDWVSRQAVGAPLRGKPVAVLGTSPGQFGGVWAHGELRRVLGIVGARVHPAELAVAKGHERLPAPNAELLAELRAFIGAVLEPNGIGGRSPAIAA